ncbi:glycosyltransferase [uncultured Alistipes sp.]|uniref:glycosyltransferase n=1 Tax=uncultured Alistipes sp. TaxID=538949 RepID=UPI00263A1CCD|nr:glycosyltransferase [uncultured Alistipes sp.]
MIRLSLIIATYNRARPLLEALESVVAQDAPPALWECVVVNNNSQDDTEARFADFAARHPAFALRMVREPRQGLSHARNCGIAAARGEYLAIIDDDERINPGFVAAYIRFFDTHPDAVAAGGRIIPEYPAGRPAWMSRFVERPVANPLDLGGRVRLFPAGRIPGGGNMALRRTAVERCGGFDPALGRVGGRLIGGEESDLFARLARAGERCWYVPDAVMWHIIPPEKLTDDYLARLAYNVGVSQQLRARRDGRYAAAVVREGGKWCATLVLACTMRPCRAVRLLRMRYRIACGLFASLGRE